MISTNRPSLRTIVLAAAGQDVRRCGNCALCEDIVCDDQDVPLQMLVQWVIVNDERALTCRTLWSDPFMQKADGACTNDLDVPAIFMALRAEARRRGIQPKESVMANDLSAQVLRPIELVTYQDGSVVSRTLISQKTGTVTLFAFDAGQELSEHTAPYDALVEVLDGETEITIGGQPFHLKSGDMIIMPANQPHAVQAQAKFKMMLTMIRS